VSSENVENIAQAPVSILFNPNTIAKKDVWEIDIVSILDLLIAILKKTEKKDLRVAGMAALSSSLIHRMKVERIFALQKAAMEKKPLRQRQDVDIQMLTYRTDTRRHIL
jgi:segregation and condensation protein A